MSGRVNPAAVFLSNTHLAQRHANALLFSRFLRKLAKETGSVSTRQKVVLEGFLSPAALNADTPDGGGGLICSGYPGKYEMLPT
jgi:hypothetical protein